MNESEYDRLLQAGRRRTLTAEEEARLRRDLAAHPETRAAWEEEMNLNRCLRQLPDAPLASNFTAQVLREIGRQRPPARSESWLAGRWRRVRSLNLVQKAASAAMILCLAMLSYYQYVASARETRARSLAQVSSVAALTSVDTLKDFETIRRLSLVDTELLENLQ